MSEAAKPRSARITGTVPPLRGPQSGTRPVVGVNRFVSAEEPPEVATYELDAEGRELQLKRLARVKAERDSGAVQASLAALARAAEGTENLMAPLIDCASAYCTVGEITSALKEKFGVYQPPTRF